MSLFEKKDEQPKVQTPVMHPEFMQPKREAYTDVDLWNKLQNTAQKQNCAGVSTPDINEEFDKKYGLTRPVQTRQEPVVSQPVNIERTARLDSNIKVDNAEIPPFLRRKFNK